MKLTIIPSDNVVLVDGRALRVELGGFAQLEGLHAVQWNGSKGHIEFDNRDRDNTEFKLNEKLTNIEAYQDIVDAWMEAKIEDDARIAAAQEALQKS